MTVAVDARIGASIADFLRSRWVSFKVPDVPLLRAVKQK